MRRFRCWGAFAGLVVVVLGVLASASLSAADKPQPLYLLTYDHGGLILWGSEHFAERLRDAISWLDKYPDFKIGLDNEAHMYDELAEQNPQLLDELRNLLKKYQGRFGIGTCTYGQPLSQFVGEESNIRQIGYAIEADQKHLGYRPVIYLMSEHAMHSQMPQILRGFGFKGAIMRTHYMMYGYNPTYNEPIGWWVGLDGSRIPTVPTYQGEGAEFGKTTVDNWILTRYPSPECADSLEVFRQRFQHIQPLLATRADDSGLRREALVREYSGNPSFRWLLLDELLPLFPKPTAEFKTRPDDFTVRMPWGYCGNEIWNRSREAEVQVLTAERLAAIGALLGDAVSESELQTAWKNLLVAQHHDVQIVGLLPDARRFLSASMASSSRVRDASIARLSGRMKGEGFSQVTVFNPVSWRRQEWIETHVSLSRNQAKALAVKTGGRVVPSVLLHADRFSSNYILDARLAFLADVSGLAVKSYSIIAAEASDSALAAIQYDAGALQVTTPYWEVKLNPRGGLASLVNRSTGRAVFTPGKRSLYFAARVDGNDSESQGRWVLRPDGEQPGRLMACEYGFIAGIPYTLEMVFRPDSPRLDCRVEFEFAGQKIGQLSDQPRDSVSAFVHEHKLRVKAFPETGDRAVGVRDLPFAVAETTAPYVEGNYWTATAGSAGGLAFFNKGTMGAVRESDGGFSIPLAHSMYYIWGTRILRGKYTYEFSVCPFEGGWRQADLHRNALAYNFPMVSWTGGIGNGSLGDEVRVLDVDSGPVLLSALYPQGGAVVARFYEITGAPGELTFTSKGTWNEVDLAGNVLAPAGRQSRFGPWQFKTFRTKN